MLTAHLAKLVGALNALIAGFRHDSVQIAVLEHLHALDGSAAGRADIVLERTGVQAAFQQHIDASISSTVNVPNSFTVEDTEHLYLLAYESGCKGVTIFRDGCKRAGILTTHVEDHKKEAPLQGKALPAEKSLPLMTMSSARNEN